MKETIDYLVGRTVTAVTETVDTLKFSLSDGTYLEMYHQQDCCESVYIEDIDGDVQDLVGQEIIVAEDRSNEDFLDALALPSYDSSWLWTFYVIRTVKSSVSIRWFGTSNGYYSVSVDIHVDNL